MFKNLPAELIDMIFYNILDIYDAMALAYTNTILFHAGYEIVQSRLEEMHWDWEGCRLICLGESSSIDDLPTDIFTEDEIDEVNEWVYPLLNSTFSFILLGCMRVC